MMPPDATRFHGSCSSWKRLGYTRGSEPVSSFVSLPRMTSDDVTSW